MATIQDLLNRINKSPCTPDEVRQSITNITNVLNGKGGTIWARCTLTNEGTNCGDSPLTVTEFNPLVTAEEAALITVPTQAVQYQNIAIGPGVSKVGYIAFHPEENTWEVMRMRETIKTVLVPDPQIVDNHTILIPTETYSVNDCEDPGQVEITFATETLTVVRDLAKAAGAITWEDVEIEVWSVGGATPGVIPLVSTNVVREIYKDECTVRYRNKEIEVFETEDLFDEEFGWLYDDYIVALVDVFLAEDGNIWGTFQEAKVPCLGPLTQAMLIETTTCGSGSGGQ